MCSLHGTEVPGSIFIDSCTLDRGSRKEYDGVSLNWFQSLGGRSRPHPGNWDRRCSLGAACRDAMPVRGDECNDWHIFEINMCGDIV